MLMFFCRIIRYGEYWVSRATFTEVEFSAVVLYRRFPTSNILDSLIISGRPTRGSMDAIVGELSFQTNFRVATSASSALPDRAKYGKIGCNSSALTALAKAAKTSRSSPEISWNKAGLVPSERTRQWFNSLKQIC
jgi:hypothetical protein